MISYVFLPFEYLIILSNNIDSLTSVRKLKFHNVN